MAIKYTKMPYNISNEILINQHFPMVSKVYPFWDFEETLYPTIRCTYIVAKYEIGGLAPDRFFIYETFCRN
jgi:hypothetical protein